jgi:hypothetical protein
MLGARPSCAAQSWMACNISSFVMSSFTAFSPIKMPPGFWVAADFDYSVFALLKSLDLVLGLSYKACLLKGLKLKGLKRPVAFRGFGILGIVQFSQEPTASCFYAHFSPLARMANRQV